MDTIATLVSVSLQYGVPVESLVRKFEHVRFEPSGMTRNPEIPIAKSLVDYIFRWLAMEFVPGLPRRQRPQARKSPAPAVEPPASRSSRRPPGRSTTPATDPPNPHRPAQKERPRPPHRARLRPSFDYATAPTVEPRTARASRPRPPPRPRLAHVESQVSHRRRSAQPARQRAASRRPRLRRLRQHHRPKRHLLQMPELREFDGVQLSGRMGSAGSLKMGRA